VPRPFTDREGGSLQGRATQLRNEYVASIRVLGEVVRSPDLRRVLVAFGLFSISEVATWIAIGVYAFRTNGPAAVGLVSMFMLLPSALVAPFGSSLGDRYRRERVLLLAYLAQGVINGATGAALIGNLPPAAVYVLAAAAAASQTLVRPAQSALLPALSSNLQEFTAANVALVTMRNLGLLVGPIGAAVILQAGSTGAVYVVMAVLLVGAAVYLTPVRPRVSRRTSGSPRGGGHTGGAFAGFGVVVREPRARIIVLLLSSKFLVQGMLRVLLVVLALQLLHLAPSGVGWLNAALGLGGALATGATVFLIGRRRLSPAFGAGIVLWGLPLAMLYVLPPVWAVGGLCACAGAGRSLMDVSGRTFLARVSPDAVLARVFGALESVYAFALAVGSLVASGLIVWAGSRGSLLVAGALLPALAITVARQLMESDQGPLVSQRELDLLMSTPIFAPLSPPVVERIASQLVHDRMPAGATIIREGEEGDRFYLIEAGRVEVTVAGHHVAELGAGSYFGEIALLRDVPRTATVVAQTEVEVWSLERNEFLLAIAGEDESAGLADALVESRLEELADVRRLDAPEVTLDPASGETDSTSASRGDRGR
jgi:MFS family permease